MRGERIYGTLFLEHIYDGPTVVDLKQTPLRLPKLTGCHWALRSGSPDAPATTRIKSGDVLTVFNSVSHGHVLWRGRIDLDYTAEREGCDPARGWQAIDGFWVNGVQRDVDPEKWLHLFQAAMPAVLKKDGKTVFGALHAYSEAQTEGIVWAVGEFGKNGYEGLHVLEAGDDLCIYGGNVCGNVAFHRRLTLSPRPAQVELPNRYIYPMFTTPQDVDASDIVRYFAQHHPARILRNRRPA